MKIKNISILSSLEDIKDIYDDNIDVSVQLEDNRTYVVVVGTAKNLLTLMDNEKSDFLSVGDPIIIVRKLTEKVIRDATEAYAQDQAYYLKFYAAALDVKTLNVLKERSIARDKLLDKLLEKGESIEIKNYDLIDFKITDNQI